MSELGQSRALLLAILVVVATGGAIFVMGKDEEPAEKKVVEAPEEEVLEVTPLLTRGAIRSASWHTDGDASEDEDIEAGAEPESLLDRLGQDKSSKEERFEKSLEKTVDNIHGLGIYVAPSEKKKSKDD